MLKKWAVEPGACEPSRQNFAPGKLTVANPVPSSGADRDCVRQDQSQRCHSAADKLLLLALFTLSLSSTALGQEIRFARDVQPVLSDNCFQCHGPDSATRKAGLRLDQAEMLFKERNGIRIVAPGKPEESELFRRITSHDPDEIMPPETTGKKLGEHELALLRLWIEQGAVWEEHWAFVPPLKAPLPPAISFSAPAIPNEGSVRRHPVDAFVQDQLVRENLAPSPEADRRALIRRLSFDLTGLPPAPEEVDAFLSDSAPDAYERLVDRLLASPHYGERMAMMWMDAARYADTDGYQGDETRTNWPWRDWVVAAFNENKPFDQFTIEQFAGDLLPGATPENRLATTFHRNHMTNGEGGRDPEESRIDYVIDRVNSVGTVWLGLTLSCAQCHTHKYDPITHQDYFKMAAFFNSIAEDGRAGRGAKPYMKYQSPLASQAVMAAENLLAQRTAELEQAREEVARGFESWLARQASSLPPDFQSWKPLRARLLESADGTVLRQDEQEIVMAGGPDPHQEEFRIAAPAPLDRVTGLRLEVFPHESFTQGRWSRSPDGHFILTTLKVSVRNSRSRVARPVAIARAAATFSADKQKEGGFGPVREVLDDDPRTGWTLRGNDSPQEHVAVFAFAEVLAIEPGDELFIEMGQRSLAGQQNIGRFRLSVTDQAGPAVESVEPAPLDEFGQLQNREISSLPPELRERLLETYLAEQPNYQQARTALERANRAHQSALEAAGELNVMVLEELPKPRATHVLIRGEWDQKGEEVQPGIPEAIAPWPEHLPANRLGLAQWLVEPGHPLTARVIVNQLWQMLFGQGLVRTPEDFGLQGEGPTHPELLDWLAVDFVESGWDVKQLLKLLVTSHAYRQDSAVNEMLLERDPENRLLARGARFRWPAWMLRDAALAASELLSPVLGGPPVKPYQPDGVWEEIFMGRFNYEPSEGSEQYRRTLYAFWRRTIAPTFLFDCAERRVSQVNVPRTNTPLQALALMNDLTYIEAARALASLAIAASPEPRERMAELTRRVLARSPKKIELSILERQLDQAMEYYQAHPEAARQLLSHGQWRSFMALDPVEHAAYTLVAMLVLNLDETLNRE